MERETLGSRLGFILLSAGCAIGIGNVWKFPYLTGEFGGGIFVLLYLVFLALLGVPVMTMEFAMGRAARKSPVKMYQVLEKPGSRWHIHGMICMIGNIMLMMFYTSVCGWLLQYFLRTACGQFVGKDPGAVAEVFSGMKADPAGLMLSMAVIVALGFLICSAGLQNGLERVTKVIMLLLLFIMVLLAVNGLFLEGAAEGLRFYMLPDADRIKAAGMGRIVTAAMSQALFTLSVGLGGMAIFGSYIGKDHALLGESAYVAVLDTFVAITSGFIIMPACFAYGVQPDAGPGLIFITLPNIFNNMSLGRLWGSLFFVFMTFAALSTVLAVFENIIACVMDLTGWRRKKTCLICAVLMFLLSLPCLLGFNVLSGIKPLGPDSDIMALEDLIVSNILLPAGSLIFVLFCTWRRGWGWKAFVQEANTGKGPAVPGWIRPYLTFVLPVIILAVLIIGFMPMFR